ncbi:hypothetical protein CAEBREN_29650 [Caenorhabditis brenneri]|uniref:PAX-interacting protein 1 n=1 Tax=Caenorhabditis brenneri TaxID=135651 RepID=G0NUI6_CAEBE|nr:hypothetical protein CAEBREN_29650 [Caenorhabditis brenneri]
MSDSLEKEEDVNHLPESPPLGLLDPARMQNPLAVDQMQQIPQQMTNETGFVMPEQPRQQPPQPNWQRTPTMSPASVFQPGSGTPGSQRSSTGTPNHQMSGQPQQQFFQGESPIHPQAPMTPQGAGQPPVSNSGTPQSAGPPQAVQAPFDYQAAQMQQQQHAQAMAAAAAAQQQQQYGNQNQQQMHDYRMMGMHQHPGHPQYPPGYPPTQWQQQMYARQAAAAAQQRAAAQRVPYPPAAYQPGMPGAPSPMTPVYPPQTPTAPRTTPGSAGPASGPPGTPQRPQYPQGTNPQPQPQFAYPPTQQMTPTGQPPGYPGIPGTPTFPSPAHQMYRQGPPTAPPGMRQYISPQAGQQQTTPGASHRFPPQVTPGATSSPHFASAPGAIGPDLRSPSLMSPNQHPSQQHTPVLPRASHNEVPLHAIRPGALTSQPLSQPQVTPQQPLSSSSLPPQSAGGVPFVYRGPTAHMHHDPNAFPAMTNADPELFLTGFHFLCFEPDKLFEDRLDRHNLEFMIKYHVVGGCFRKRESGYSLENSSPTISIQRNVQAVFRKSTILYCHEITLTYINLQLFSLSGFDESERGAISFMAEAMGAKITPFLAKQNDLVIAKVWVRDCSVFSYQFFFSSSEKVTKALEWKIPVVNYQWIADAYVCGSAQPHERPNVENPRYQLGQPCPEVNGTPAIIEMCSNEFAAMICKSKSSHFHEIISFSGFWKQPIILDDQKHQKARNNKKEVLTDEYFFPARRLKRYSEQSVAPTDEEINTALEGIKEIERLWKEHLEEIGNDRMHKDYYKVKEPQPKITIWFGDAIDDETLTILKKKVQFLGGSCTEKIQNATHLIMMSGHKSLALLEGIIRGKNIMQPEWIVDSYFHKKWLGKLKSTTRLSDGRVFADTFDYFLHDEKLEKECSYNCMRSVLRAQNKPVFEDMEFHVTRFVEPNRKDLVRLIELAGGKVHEDKPDPKYLARCIETEQPFIIISCENDARFLSYLAEAKLPIYNVDLILFAMLRQVVEPLPQFRIPIPIVVKTPVVFRQPPPYTASSREQLPNPPVPRSSSNGPTEQSS